MSHTSREEQDARIRKVLSDMTLIAMDAIKRSQGIRYTPYMLALTGIGIGVALCGAAIALLKWIG